jgi:sugar lactone lactonase YvrE
MLQLVTRVALAMLLSGTAADAARSAITTAPGWTISGYVDELPAVDNLVVVDDTLYASLELPMAQGRVVAIRDGSVTNVLTGLNRPDGLAIAGSTLYVVEEVAKGRLIALELDTRRRTILGEFSNPEGLAIAANGDIYISEDVEGGRILQLRAGAAPVVLLRGLRRPEGIRFGRNGELYIAETLTGRVLEYRDGRLTILMDGLREPDQLALAPDGALWIAEDARPGRILRWHAGVSQVIVDGLDAPQGMAFDRGGSVFIAEQGRARILRLRQP